MKIKSFFGELLEAGVIFLSGGFIYGGIEILYRGNTHPSMFVLGGLSLLWIGGLNRFYNKKPPIFLQMLIGGGIITLGEFLCGIVVNLWLNLKVWDYSNLPFNIMGQICLLFTLIWIALSYPAIIIEDYLRKGMETDRESV